MVISEPAKAPSGKRLFRSHDCSHGFRKFADTFSSDLVDFHDLSQSRGDCLEIIGTLWSRDGQSRGYPNDLDLSPRVRHESRHCWLASPKRTGQLDLGLAESQ
jgi:hypothetical protein